MIKPCTQPISDRELSPETSLIQRMSDASFRAMDQEEMLKICTSGLTELLGGQGTAIFSEEMEERWILSIHRTHPFLPEDLEKFSLSCRSALYDARGRRLPDTSCRNHIRITSPDKKPLPLSEWCMIPLRADSMFLGVLFLDPGEHAEFPDWLSRVIHQLCTGLMASKKRRQLIITDPMTTCYNRWYMDVELSKFCEHLNSRSAPFAVMLMDIDHFKHINDHYGHSCGDQVLVLFADLLRKKLRDSDASVRMGGDEFLVWFHEVDGRDLKKLGENLRRTVEKNLRMPKAPTRTISLSMGLIIQDPSVEVPTKEQILDRVDHALYTSKRRGRNQLTVWEPDLEEQPWLWSDPEGGIMDEIKNQQNKIYELEHRIQKDEMHLVELLTNILSTKEFETGLHSHRVSLITEYLLNQLEVSDEERTAIHRGAMLHDIGKIAIPEAILHKQGALTESDWVIMQQHPRLGHRFIENQRFLESAADVVLYHHENFDGSGYPWGLSGKDIPYGARLFRVIDAYDSMRSNRVYKPYMSRKDATGELEKNRNRQFDPEILDLFLDHLDQIEKIGCWQT